MSKIVFDGRVLTWAVRSYSGKSTRAPVQDCFRAGVVQTGQASPIQDQRQQAPNEAETSVTLNEHVHWWCLAALVLRGLMNTMHLPQTRKSTCKGCRTPCLMPSNLKLLDHALSVRPSSV